MAYSPASTIVSALSQHLDTGTTPLHLKPLSGGSINQCFRLEFSNQSFFLKVNDALSFPGMFNHEAFGLDHLRHAGFPTPQVLHQFNHLGQQFLLLQWISPGTKTNLFWKKFGEGLARLHHCHELSYGAVPDNYIGSLPQANQNESAWPEFYIKQRLKPQITLASKHGYLETRHRDAFEQLFLKLDQFFPAEKPSLLHGDLWSGNFLCDQDSNPFLIDPAIYYGHRAMDIGMTRLFGGYDQAFYEAYNYHLPFPDHINDQVAICQLYPLLVHLNLFGLSYLDDISVILQRYTGRK